MCHNPQPYCVSNTHAKYCHSDLNLVLQPMFLLNNFRKKYKAILYRYLFQVYDVLRGTFRNTGKLPTFSPVTMHMNSTGL